MALVRLFRASHQTIKCYNFNIIRTLNSLQVKSKKENSEEDDALDEFVTQLVLEKSDKWKTLTKTRNVFNNKNASYKKLTRQQEEINLNDRNVEEIDNLFKNALDDENYELTLVLMKECIRWQKCPTVHILIKVLPLFSQRGEKELIIEIQDLYEKVDPNVINANSGFQHYLAEATWMKGNIDKALTLFDSVYRNSPFLRRHIKCTLKYLILDIINERSEAVLNTMINFCNQLVLDYKDYYLLACVWQACFLSEWYSDQCTAMKILERHNCPDIINKIPYVVNLALKGHQADSVHHILEFLLKHNLKLQYTLVLMSLFNYRLKQRDLSSCQEIIQWSINNNVELPAVFSEKFIGLLLKSECYKGSKNMKRKRSDIKLMF